MYRLIFSELSCTVGLQSSVKIELFTSALCGVPLDSLQYLDMADIKDILRSCRDDRIDVTFGAEASKALAMECPLCYGTYPRSKMEAFFLCDDTCCTNCAKEYYKIAINNM